MAPIAPAKDKQAWVFQTPQSFVVMAAAIAEHMANSGVKTVGYIGYNDPYGEGWLKAIQAATESRGIRVTAVERYNRADTTVTGQVLKLLSSNADAVLVAASGTPAVLPQSTQVARVLLMAEPASIDAGEITDKGYINQGAVLRRRNELVEQLYSPSPEVIRLNF